MFTKRYFRTHCSYNSFLMICFCAMLLAQTSEAAQSPPAPDGVKGAELRGQVLGPDGAPVPGVSVFLRRNGVDLAVREVTDAEGRFVLGGLAAPASYQVMSAIGSLLEAGPIMDLPSPGVSVPVTITLRLNMAEQVSVAADVWTLPVGPPNSIVSRTSEQMRQQNLFNPEDAVRSVPSTTIRKRYIGDRNALVGGRSFGTLQPSRALVYLDGYLLSNFLGRFDAPRWNMVTAEAMERVDVLYGPFSAVHAGNSIGTTIVMTERIPSTLDWGVRATHASQGFSQYGESGTFGASQLSAYAGGRTQKGLWAAVAFNHQDATSQPMQYYNVTANAAGAFPAVSGSAVPVSGIQYDVDPKGLKRALFGSSAGAIDHTKQDTLKFRAGYTLASVLDVSGLIAGWQNDTENRNTTFLRDGSGNEVWSGVVTDGTNSFTLPATALAPSLREETHLQSGITVRSRRPTGWNGSLIVSDYRILGDALRQANTPDPTAASGGVGTVTRRDGTGWWTVEAQATRTPIAGGRHTLTFGVHRNAYRLLNVVNDASDWRSVETTLNQNYTGHTTVNALYGQDVIALTKTIKATLGWRAEWFDAMDGSQLARVNSCVASAGVTCVPNGDGTSNKVLTYEPRALAGHSPKASVTWTATQNLLVRASVGRGVRFPNVEELYNGTVTATSLSVSDPNLKAERSTAVELSAEHFWTNHMLRSTFFLDDVHDAILRQSDATVTPSITRVSNVDRVRTPGLEFFWVANDFPSRKVNVEGNVTFASSKVIENSRDPLSVGKYWLRVPKTRGGLTVAYRPTDRWMGSVGYRHQGRSYNDVYNLDIFPNVYGGVSSVNQVDLRLSYKPTKLAEVAVGVDNVSNGHSYVSHPYPGRTMFVELRVAPAKR